MHTLCFRSIKHGPLLDIHVLARSRRDWRKSFRSVGSLSIIKVVVSSAKRTVKLSLKVGS